MEIKLQKMAYADYNGINIRLRTVFQANNKKWFIEISTGVMHEKYYWIIITHLFRIDIEEDLDRNYTKEAGSIINEYYKLHLEYNEENIIGLFEKLGLKNVKLKYCDYKEYDTRNYELGHETKIEQMSLF